MQWEARRPFRTSLQAILLPVIRGELSPLNTAAAQERSMPHREAGRVLHTHVSRIIMKIQQQAKPPLKGVVVPFLVVKMRVELFGTLLKRMALIRRFCLLCSRKSRQVLYSPIAGH
ncbi:hypothetical protein D3C85_850390 [compost metagenome]